MWAELSWGTQELLPRFPLSHQSVCGYFPGLGKAFLTLLPQGCGAQDRLAVPPSAREPRGAPARDDKRSRVPPLQPPADLHQHGVIFACIACGMDPVWRSVACRGGWPLSPALSASQVGIGAQLRLSLLQAQGPTSRMQSSKCQELANAQRSEQL